jgi:nicotinic acid phosphoribosyltransferase
MSEEAGPAPVASDLFGHFNKRAGELSDKNNAIKIHITRKKKQGEGVEEVDVNFKELLTDPAFETIISNFKYPDDGDTSMVVDIRKLINAFFANDLYKLSMAPVIHHVTFDNNGCIVQFKVDLRTYSTFNEELKTSYVMNSQSSFAEDLVRELDKLKERLFDNTMFDSYVNVPYNQDVSPPVPRWKDPAQFIYPISGRNLTATHKDDIIRFYNNITGAALTDTNFHDDTLILNCIPVPKDPRVKCPVVLSVFFESGAESPDIRATGFWPWCSWLETPLMQCAYEVMHQHYLKVIMPKQASKKETQEEGSIDNSQKEGSIEKTARSNTYGAWMAESLFRTFTGINFLQKTEKPIKVALFSGRRTGGALFNLLQVYLWNMFDTQFNATSNPSGRNLGTSSFWALKTLGNMGYQCAIQPSGTHAHELSMTLNVLYGDELDVYDEGFVGSQILGHLLYKRLSAGKTPTPMLTDTVGTRNFLETALQLKDTETDKPAFCSFASARQDSGKLPDYARIMRYYSEKAGCTMPLLMASEIDERNDDFKLAIDEGYILAGVGGALGDSEKIDSDLVLGIKWPDSKKGDVLEGAFAASEAAKITRVWGGTGKTGYTLKTGDNDNLDKVTYDKKAEKAIIDELLKHATTFQALHQKAVKGNYIDFGPIVGIQEKQAKLDQLLKRIVEKTGGANILDEKKRKLYDTVSSLEKGTMPGQGYGDTTGIGHGGRRTRRRARKVTKKYVRKNIRKSKNKKSRRSYRRKSKK